MGKKELMDRDGVKERGQGSYRAALTSLERNGERESEERCKWTAVAATHHISDSPGSVTASLTF